MLVITLVLQNVIEALRKNIVIFCQAFRSGGRRNLGNTAGNQPPEVIINYDSLTINSRRSFRFDILQPFHRSLNRLQRSQHGGAAFFRRGILGIVNEF